MSNTPCRDIAIVGCGNVASHLAHALKDRVGWVLNRTPEAAQALANSIGAHPVPGFHLPADARPAIILISVADHAIADVAAAIGPLEYHPLVLHTSGTMPKEVLTTISPRTGILYPLQSFTRGCRVDLHQVPFFTEAAEAADLPVVDALAHSISTRVYHADANSRKALHIAGVLTNNFTNILLEYVQRVLAPEGYDLDVVRPLLEATVQKAFAIGPHAAQTGPARRGDTEVIRRHIDALPADMRPAYRTLSDAILHSHNILNTKQ